MTILMLLITILILIWWSIPNIQAQGFPFNLDFQKFDANNSNMFNFLGRAKIDLVSQTLQLSDASDISCQTSPCVGQVFFPQPVQVLDPVTNKTYSFSTSFTFTIISPMRFRTGDGFVFLLATNPQQISTKVGTFGCFLPNSSKSLNPIIAVEFDTFMNNYLHDINDNHVGIDINYAQSVKASNADILNIKLSSGLLITSWIDYHHIYKLIEVRLSYYKVGIIKPRNPIFTLPLDLSSSWTPQMYVGFSTQIYHGSEQSCNIFSWSFKSFIETILPPPPPPSLWHPPPAPMYNESGHSTWSQKTVELRKLIGVAIGAFVFIAGVCGATVGYARFGNNGSEDPTDLLDPDESLLIIKERKEEDESDNFEERISSDIEAFVSDKRTQNHHMLEFGDIMFKNDMYNIPFVDSSKGVATNITTTPSTKIIETISQNKKNGIADISGYDDTRAPLEEQVILFLETSRAGVENSTEALRFTYKELSEATDNFSESLQLGEGRYGVFYGGILANGVQIAVKRLTILKNQITQKFRAEISMLYRLQHPNLVSILGWCKQNQEYFLIYNLISRGNLSRIIFQKGALSWSERFKIIQNIAGALEYLHKNHILHKNIKVTNIFLTDDNDGKLGDFGLAWLMDHDEDKGTKEYVAREVRKTHNLTKQTDVFSLGIVILEILCERPFYDPDANYDALFLVNMVSILVDNNTLKKVISKDMEQLQEEMDDPLMSLVANLGLLCCDRDPTTRPSMKTVVQCLKGDIPFPPKPESPHQDTISSYEIMFTAQKTNSNDISSNMDKTSQETLAMMEISTIKEKKSIIPISSKKRSRSNTSSKFPSAEINISHETNFITQKKDTTFTTAQKKNQKCSSSSNLSRMDTTFPYRMTSFNEKKNKIIVTTSKNSQGSTSSSKSSHIIPTPLNMTTFTIKKKESSISNEQEKNSGSTSLATNLTLSTNNIPSYDTRQGTHVIVSSLKQQTILKDSSLDMDEDNHFTIQADDITKIKSNIFFTPKLMKLDDETKSSPHEEEFRISITYEYCYSLMIELVSILLNYVDDESDTLSDILDLEMFQHNESKIISKNPLDPSLRPSPNPPFRPSPPPHPRSPSPSPVPEPDPIFPIPHPIRRQPPPLRPSPSPRPPPPQGSKAQK